MIDLNEALCKEFSSQVTDHLVEKFRIEACNCCPLLIVLACGMVNCQEQSM